MNIPFIDLDAQKQFLGQKIEDAVSNVLKHKKFINGPEVSEFEKLMSEFSHVNEVITCGSGTDALLLPLMAIGVGKGDAVFVPSFTFVATANSVKSVGAKPVFVDILKDNYTMDPDDLKKKITRRSRAIIPVHLYGHMAYMDEILEIAKKKNIKERMRSTDSDKKMVIRSVSSQENLLHSHQILVSYIWVYW